MDNRAIANRLLQHARDLYREEPNMYRVRAYRIAAETVMRLDRSVADIVTEHGRKGLEELPGIGAHLSYTIDGLVRTGEFHTMDTKRRRFSTAIVEERPSPSQTG
jgi:DNA polymerase/3'-5' exonuclease PolX